MTKRRSHGDGGLHWDEERKRWIASVTTGYNSNGKRIVRKASGKTKTEAKEKLKEILRDHEDGLAVASHSLTVKHAVEDWLSFGLNGRSEKTVETCTILATVRILPSLGSRKLRELSADDVDRWLRGKSKTLSTRTPRDIRSILAHAVKRAQARDKVKRNVVLLCEVPAGQAGRPSKSLTYVQAEAVLYAAEADRSTIGTYTVVSLVSGARTEELRPLELSFPRCRGLVTQFVTQQRIRACPRLVWTGPELCRGDRI
jgi:hypothetical protein